MFNAAPQLMYPRKKEPVPIAQEPGCAPGPIWTASENLAPTRFRFPDRPARSGSLAEWSTPANTTVIGPTNTSLPVIYLSTLPQCSTFHILKQRTEKEQANQNTCARRLGMKTKTMDCWRHSPISKASLRGWSLETCGGTNRNRSTVTSSVLRDKC
jgi:hypothetical protein